MKIEEEEEAEIRADSLNNELFTLEPTKSTNGLCIGARLSSTKGNFNAKRGHKTAKRIALSLIKPLTD